MTDQEFFGIATFQYRLKNMTRKVKEFESIEKYVRMRQEFQSVFREQNRTIKRPENELVKAHAETVSVRKIWSEVMNVPEAGHKKKTISLRRENERLMKRTAIIQIRPNLHHKVPTTSNFHIIYRKDNGSQNSKHYPRCTV